MSGFRFSTASEVSEDALNSFIAAVFPGRDPYSFWWRRSGFAQARVAVTAANGDIAGLCVGVPGRWPVAGETRVAISICGWFVHPDHMGRGLGKQLVESFADVASAYNAFSISDAACRNFTKLGWSGPWRSHLRLLPLPALRSSRTGPGFRCEHFDLTHKNLPLGLARHLDRIEQGRPAGMLRLARDSGAWAAHLAIHPDRRYRCGVLLDDEVPVAFWAIRSTDGEAGRAYRMSRLHYVSDIVCNAVQPDILMHCARGVAGSAPVTAGALLLCTSRRDMADALTRAGWLNENSPVLGKQLADKAPRFMFGGDLADIDASKVQLSFFDSDVDFNI